ncbi:MAG: (2Fe-2S)-binding protein [Pseudonocardia sp.]|nr:(2Fe-2S)-binding protein [Pseudonocardia sp.]
MDPHPSVRRALSDAARVGPFFEIGTNPAEEADPTWRPFRALVEDPEPLRARIAHVRAVLGGPAGPGAVEQRVAASIALQGLAARLVSGPLAVAVLHGIVPAVTADELHWRVSATGPWPLWLAAPGEAAGNLADLLADELLGPLVDAVRAQVPVSARVLRGNVASSVAGAKRVLAAARPDAADAAARVAGEVLEHPLLAGTGELLPAGPPDVGWSFRRRSCCLYYRVPGGGTCGDCVLTGPPRGR